MRFLSPRRFARGLGISLLALGTAATAAGPYDDGVQRYRTILIVDIGDALAGARKLHERVTAGDAAGAKVAWLAARAGWERSEVFTSGFVPALDRDIDAWPDASRGFHAIEAKLFGKPDGLLDGHPQSSKVDLSGAAANRKAWQCRRTGGEILDGRLTTTWRAVSPQQRTYGAWIDRELKFPLRITTNFGTSFSLTEIVQAPQPASLFRIPLNFKKFDPQALIDQIKHSDVWVEPVK